MAQGESKSYNPAAVEKRIFDFWMQGGYFVARPDDRPPDQRFCMVIPPPNVTGALHLGHALNNTLQDILVRHKRMAGFNTFWLVGTDHAGIATQAVVEKTIREQEGKSRHDLGREELVRRIWEWKEKFGGRIVEQLKLMGCSCDYSRERFTLDEGCAKAVRETFFKLFRDGLIYRGKRLVNWDTQLQTAVADDEVYHETVKGHFYHFKYPIVAQASSPVSDEPTHVHIATTRPETMLADTAVAVHPDPARSMDAAEKEAHAKLAECAEKERASIQARIDDIAERKRSLLPTLIKLRDMARASRKIKLPLTEREIPLICDEWADPTLGTGCVKITPAHDANDYDVGQRHKLPLINVLTPDGKIARIVEADGSVNPHSAKYEGLRFATKGREKVVEDMQALGLVEKIDDRLIDLGHSDRSKAPIEPYLSDQWFVRMGDLDPDHAARIQGSIGVPPVRNSSELGHESEPRPSGSGPLSNLRASKSADSPLPHGRGSDRSGTFTGLGQMAIDAVKSGKVKFHPERYAKTYLDWLGEKRDWCISRQLWWGHRIPVWRLEQNKLVDGTREQFPADFRDRLEQYFTYLDLGQHVAITANKENSEVHICLRSDKPIRAYDALVGWLFATMNDDDFFYESDESTFKSAGHQKAHELLADWFGLCELPDQDPDVLDTWFSSALWPHSTLGWPDAQTEPRPSGSGQRSNAGASGVAESPLPYGRGSDVSRGSDLDHGSDQILNYYYPTSVLSTAREIITLWVARMVITGLYNMGDVPFKDVFIHAVIQDGQGRKMSKSLGNGVDPVDIIEEYGADALRFTLADLATETQDIRLPVKPKKLPDGRTINISEKFEKGRNFCNKLWQASTGFVLRNLDGYAPKPLDPKSLRLEDRWILSRMTACQKDLDEALASYRFAEAAGVVYRFMWDEYCSWYIEMMKPRVGGTEARRHEGTKGEVIEHGTALQVLVFVLDQLLRMLHPFVPFVTEAIWAELNAAAPRRGLAKIEDAEPALVAARWPIADPALRDEQVESQMAILHGIIKSARDIRADVNDYRGKAKQPSVRTLAVLAIRADAGTCRLIESYRGFLLPLAGCDTLEAGERIAKPAGAMGRVNGRIEVYCPVGELVDLSALRETEGRKLDELRGQLTRESGRLSNADFTSRADPAVVEQARQRCELLSSQIAAIERHLADMS